MFNLQNMLTIQDAGAIILSQEDSSLVLLLYRSNEKDWAFPKGRVEKGEEQVEAAKREVLEETRLSVRLINKLPPTEYIHHKGHRVIVSMFLMQSEDDSKLKPEFEGDEVVWVHYKDVSEKLTYDNIKEYYNEVFYLVEKEIEVI